MQIKTFKDGKAKITDLKNRVAEEKDDATAQEQILKTLIAEKTILEERRRICARYPEEIGYFISTL